MDKIGTNVRYLYHFPAESELEKKLTDPCKSFSRGISRAVGEYAIIVLWYVRNAVRSLKENSFAGVRNIVVSSGLNLNGRSVQEKQEMHTLENTEEQKTGAIDPLHIQRNIETLNVLNAVLLRIYNSLTLNLFGLEVATNGQ